MSQPKKTDNAQIDGTTAPPAASADVTKSSTAAETKASEVQPSQASEFVLPKFDFERDTPFTPTPKARFSSAELFKEVAKDLETMTDEEFFKRWRCHKRNVHSGVSTQVAMDFLMKQFGSI
ncbi:unnamed protein product [Clonostachys rosea]|uniref:Uncharacterized protein n=1 Tax=Bionectria ochroleuca TaxID=29856 RepID=A0ABY6UF90_BIOOC|nr:unnamed protein product [Clonostachys rosea]